MMAKDSKVAADLRAAIADARRVLRERDAARYVAREPVKCLWCDESALKVGGLCDRHAFPENRKRSDAIGTTVFDERIGDDDDTEVVEHGYHDERHPECRLCYPSLTIGQVCEPDEPLHDVHYSHDVFLFWDALAKLAKCRYVVRNRRGIIIDTNMLCDGDVIVFDRKRYEQMGGDR